MVSGTGFQSTTSKDIKGAPRKKTVSRGLLVAAGFLVVTMIAWFGLNMMEQKLEVEKLAIVEDVRATNAKVQTSLTPEASDFAVRAYAMEDEIYYGYEANDVLKIIEENMILKNSDQSGDRVVLKSFQYNSGAQTKKNFSAGDATIVGLGSVTISADADTFEVMAQQIDVFKNVGYINEDKKELLISDGEDEDKATELAKVHYFTNVKIGTTDRDDYGRIIFTLTMSVVGYDKTPYEEKEMIIEILNEPVGEITTESVQDEQVVNVVDTEQSEEVVSTESAVDTGQGEEIVANENIVDTEQNEDEIVAGDVVDVELTDDEVVTEDGAVELPSEE